MDVRMGAHLTWEEGEAFFGLTTLILSSTVRGEGKVDGHATTAGRGRGWGQRERLPSLGRNLKHVCTEGGRGSENILILRMNSTDRLREMQTKGEGV